MERRLERVLPLAVAGVAVFALSFLAPGKPASFYDKPALDAVYGPGALVVAGVLAASCGIATMFARRWWWPLCVAALAAWLTFGSWPGMMAATYHSVVRGRRVPAAVLAGIVVVAHLAGGIISSGRFLWAYVLWAVIAAALLVALPSAVGLWMAARREVLAAARERAAQLEREQSARTDQARAEERARIAREMHDVVAHRVSLMVLHAGALEVNTADPATAEAAALIRTTGREALADLRSVLGVLRPPEVGAAPQPTLADLDALLDESRAAGVAVVRRDSGAPRVLSPSVERTTYRVVREALTNVHKHAGDAEACVSLRYGDDELEVSVRNGPSDGAPALLPGSGMGLAGLRERVELLGGQFFAGPQVDGGFRVRAVIPLGAA